MRNLDIGVKIKDARAAAGLTQEQAAEALGVSRQTISNCENEKTYPDIASVARMSDLYAVSLDKLLKGEESGSSSEYVNYLKKSTDTVESKRRFSLLILAGCYLAIWAFSLLVFWAFTGPTDAMGYALVFLWILLPATTVIISAFAGTAVASLKAKIAAATAFGAMYMLAEYATFGAANMAAFGKINAPEFELILIGAALSAIGFAAEAIAGKIRHKK